MKKLLTLFIAAFLLLAAQESKAQLVKAVTPTKTSLSAADTAAAVLPLDKTATSVEMGGTKTSGTVGGKIYFQGLNLKGDTWVKIDSLSITNTSGYQYKQIAVTTFPYASYRFYFLSTGGVWAPTAYYLRRN